MLFFMTLDKYRSKSEPNVRIFTRNMGKLFPHYVRGLPSHVAGHQHNPSDLDFDG